jgi:hypothetical protein
MDKYKPTGRPYLFTRTESLANIGADYSQQNTIIPTGVDVPFYGWIENIQTNTEGEQELIECTIAIRRSPSMPSVKDWLIKLPSTLPQSNDSRYYMRVDSVDVKGDYLILSCQSSSVPTANDPLNLNISTMTGLTNLWEPCFTLADSGRMITDSKGGQHLYGGGNATSSSADGTRSGLGITFTTAQYAQTLAAVAIPPVYTVYFIFSTTLATNTLAFFFHCGTVNQATVRIYNNSPLGLYQNNQYGTPVASGLLPPYGGFTAHTSTASVISIYPTGTAATTNTNPTADVLRINGRPSGSLSAMTFYACGIFNRALSAGELTRIKAYYTRRGVPT